MGQQPLNLEQQQLLHLEQVWSLLIARLELPTVRQLSLLLEPPYFIQVIAPPHELRSPKHAKQAIAYLMIQPIISATTQSRWCFLRWSKWVYQSLFLMLLRTLRYSRLILRFSLGLFMGGVIVVLHVGWVSSYLVLHWICLGWRFLLFMAFGCYQDNLPAIHLLHFSKIIWSHSSIPEHPFLPLQE